jgi:hypothetical protein
MKTGQMGSWAVEQQQHTGDTGRELATAPLPRRHAALFIF